MKEAQNYYFAISTSIFRMRTFSNFLMSYKWGSSPQRWFAFSFNHTVIHHHGASSGNNYNLSERSWLSDNLLCFSFLFLVIVCLYFGILQPFDQPSTFCTTSWDEIFKVVKNGNSVSLLHEQMIYSASWSIAQISVHSHTLSRIILNPDKCSFNFSHGYVHHGSPWKIIPGCFLCFLLCYFKKDLILTCCHMRIPQKHGKNIKKHV